MDKDALVAIRDLLSSTRVLALAVLVDDQPEAGLLPYAPRADFGAAYVQASGLARHSRGLRSGAQVGVLIHANDTEDSDPMQLPRLTLQATVKAIEKETDEYAAASAVFIERFPGAKMTLNLGDFTLYELAFGRGRYVEGFASAHNVTSETFKELRS